MARSRKNHRNSQTELNYNHRMLNTVVGGGIIVNRTAFLPSMSLKLGETAMLGCVLGIEECCAIRDSWRPHHPIVALTPAEFDRLVNKNPVFFAGRLADLAEAD